MELVCPTCSHCIEVPAAVDGRLTHREYQMIRFLAEHPGEVLTRDEIAIGAWGERYTHQVDVYVNYLRKKIGKKLISTVHGKGYRFL